MSQELSLKEMGAYEVHWIIHTVAGDLLCDSLLYLLGGAFAQDALGKIADFQTVR